MDVKAQRGIKLDNDMTVEELQQLVTLFKQAIKEQTGLDFPTNPMDNCGERFVQYLIAG